MDSWADILNFMGVSTIKMNFGQDIRSVVREFQPSVFITVGDPLYLAHLDMEFLVELRKSGDITVGHINTFESFYGPCDFFITSHLDPQRDIKMQQCDRPLISLPFAANPLIHYMRPGHEVWDYFFVGTNSHNKIQETRKYLFPIIKKYKGILSGTNWKHGLGELMIDEAALLYNYAKIYPNYSVGRQINQFNEVNERTFIIPACGGFELVDNPVAMRELFNDDEMAIADSAEQFHDMFENFLRNPEKRLPCIYNGMRKVYSKYTLFHVLKRLLDYLEQKVEISNLV